MPVERMSREQVRAMFPNASGSTLEANGLSQTQKDIIHDVTGKEFPGVPDKMNKTESEFARILEARKARGEIIHFAYEGIRLTWGGGMRYLADFVVIIDDKPITLIEVKGGHIWDRDIVRFKGCREEWKKYFDFEFWQKKGGEWKRVH